MPIKIPEKRNVIKTIKINNGTLTAELDDDHNVYWFRNGKYITPNQMKNYKFYDPAIKGYKQLSDLPTADVNLEDVKSNDADLEV
jgi:membrane carboxypeptidase/penicillin-binding protein PbpC